MTIVYICEKPDQGIDYGKAMGFKDLNKSKGYIEDKSNDTIITWAIGHLIKLYEPYEYDPKYKYTNSLSELPVIPVKFKFTLPTRKEESYKVKQYGIIKNILKSATEVVIATDADREGETIGREILELAGYKGKISRVLVNSLDKVGILKGIANKIDGSKTENLYKSGISRMTADWFIGINLSRAVTLANRNMVEGNLPVGRIITPTVNLVYLRDMEIENFKSKDYYDVSSTFRNEGEKSLDTSWIIPKKLLDELEEKLLNKEEAQKVVDKCKNKDGTVTKSEKKRKNTSAPLPFSLLSLQSKCYSEFGYKADQVLVIAQTLYEKHKATTYPRTDCTYLPLSQFQEVAEVIKAIEKSDPNNGTLKSYLTKCNLKQKSDAWNDSKLTAHHAIIPTTTPTDVSKMTTEELNVYDLVRRTYIAQFLPKYEYDSTTLEIECEGELFRVSGSVPAVQGWKVILNDKESKEAELPLLKLGQKIQCINIKVDSKKTKPPSRFNNSTLIQAMTDAAKYIENPELKKILKTTKGLGTVATQANIIKNTLKYDYIKEEKNNYVTTEKGRLLMEACPDMIKSIETSAYWESMLEEIAQGTKTSEEFFDIQKKALIEIISDMKDGKYRIESAVGMAYQCPKCNSGLKRIKSKKNGKFYWLCLDKEVCKSIFPDNRGKPGEAAPQAETVEQGEKEHLCVTCSNKLIRKKGQYGFYWQCSGDTCKRNYKDDNMKPVEIVKKEVNQDYKCTVCNKGFLIERGQVGKKFWGCSNFPKCKTTKKDDNGKPEGL